MPDSFICHYLSIISVLIWTLFNKTNRKKWTNKVWTHNESNKRTKTQTELEHTRYLFFLKAKRPAHWKEKVRPVSKIRAAQGWSYISRNDKTLKLKLTDNRSEPVLVVPQRSHDTPQWRPRTNYTILSMNKRETRETSGLCVMALTRLTNLFNILFQHPQRFPPDLDFRRQCECVSHFTWHFWESFFQEMDKRKFSFQLVLNVTLSFTLPAILTHFMTNAER